MMGHSGGRIRMLAWGAALAVLAAWPAANAAVPSVGPAQWTLAVTEEVTSVSFSPDGRNVLTSSRDGTAIIWLAQDWRKKDAKVAATLDAH